MQVLNPPDTPFTFMKFVRSKNFEGLVGINARKLQENLRIVFRSA